MNCWGFNPVALACKLSTCYSHPNVLEHVIDVHKQEGGFFLVLLVPALKVSDCAIFERHQHACSVDGLLLVLTKGQHKNSVAEMYEVCHRPKGMANTFQATNLRNVCLLF